MGLSISTFTVTVPTLSFTVTVAASKEITAASLSVIVIVWVPLEPIVAVFVGFCKLNTMFSFGSKIASSIIVKVTVCVVLELAGNVTVVGEV